ncbi:MAG: SurA N-terminal domain-containing protein [Desulfobulbaceae bacterium]|nr:SurA N-terminal domain-containing protein [Desulfobulbaceae bacterium]
MLALFRKHAQSVVIQFIVVLIAVVFIFWGVGQNLSNKRSLVAKINNREISLKDFSIAYENTLENYRRQFGGSIPEGFIDNMDLKNQVLRQLVRRELLLDGAEDMGIIISDHAVQTQIQDMPAFQTDGHFDLARYKAILESNRLSTSGFEAETRADMRTQRVISVLNEIADIPEREIDDFLKFRNEEIRFDYVAFKQEQYLDKVEVTDEALEKFFDLHRDNYLSPKQVRLKYLVFNFVEYQKDIHPTEAEIAARYERDKDRYITAEQRHARHILFRVEEDALPEIREAQKNKAVEVLAQAKGGKDFSELAKEYSEDSSNVKGGDLGFFSRGRMVKPFEDAAFSLHEGELSDIVESPFGYHIIKLEAIQPEVVRPLESVKDAISTAIASERAKGDTFNAASKIFNEIIIAGNLKNFAEKNDYPIKETDFFSRDNVPTDTPTDPKFLENSFGLNKGELSSLVELQQGYAIIFAEDIHPPKTPELATVRDGVAKDYRAEKAAESARVAADEFLKRAATVADLKSVTGETAPEIKDSGFLKRMNPTTNPEVPYQLATAVLNNAWNRELPDTPVEVGNNLYVFRITAHRASEEKIDDKERDQIKKQLLGQAGNRLLTDWLAMLEERADVWINKAVIQ